MNDREKEMNMLRIRKFIKKPFEWPVVGIALSVGVLLVLTSILSVFAVNPNLPCAVGASEEVPILPSETGIVRMYAVNMGTDQYPEDINLWNPILELSGALWDYFPSDQASGTGVFNTYLAVKAPGSSLLERGYNTGEEKKDHVAYYDEDDSKTSVLPLSVVPIVTINDTQYREFACDINEVSGIPDQYISLEVLQIWQTDAINIGNGTNLYSDPMSPDYEFSSGASLVYDLDCEANYTLILDYGVNTGSGKPDYKVFVPKEWFDTDLDYVIMVVVHGNLEEQNPSTKKDPNIYYGTGASSGFEEWGVRVVEPTCGEVSIEKTASPSPLGCPGETITYNLTVANAGPGTATGIYLEDILPTNMALTGVKLDGSPTMDYGLSVGVLRYPQTGGVSLDNGESFILTIEGTATDCNPLENTATVYADNDCSEEGNIDSATTNRNIPPVSLTPPDDVTLPACTIQAEIDTAWATFLAGVSYGGGCNASISNNNTGAPPYCGGTTTVEWTVTSDCEPDKTASADFTVEAPDPVSLTPPDDVTLPACTSQAEIDTAWATFLAGVSYGGGCNASISNNNTGAPPYCGGTTTVEWTVTSDCEPDKTASADFTVEAPDLLVVVCPADYVGYYGLNCSTNSTITGNVTVSGGCDPQVSYVDDMIPEPDTCNWTVTRNWTITDLCDSRTCIQHISCVCVYCWDDETAWAYGGDDANENWNYTDSNNWGWTNGPLSEGSYVWDLYAGAGQNNLSKGTVVGTVSVNYTGGCVNVTYSVIPGYYLGETHLWVGNDPLPKVSRGRLALAYTDAPGQFPYGVDYGFNSTDPGTWETEWSWSSCPGITFEGDIYVAAHGVVWMEVECEPEDGFVATVETDSRDSSDSSDSGGSFWEWLFDWFRSLFRF